MEIRLFAQTLHHLVRVPLRQIGARAGEDDPLVREENRVLRFLGQHGFQDVCRLFVAVNVPLRKKRVPIHGAAKLEMLPVEQILFQRFDMRRHISPWLSLVLFHVLNHYRRFSPNWKGGRGE